MNEIKIVGNVLNSVNLESSTMSESLIKAKSAGLAKLVPWRHQHEADPGSTFTLQLR
jgi:hypothetical protein